MKGSSQTDTEAGDVLGDECPKLKERKEGSIVRFRIQSRPCNVRHVNVSSATPNKNNLVPPVRDSKCVLFIPA